MKLTIFGATGATGISLVIQALAAGHEVTAVVRDPARLAVPDSPRLRIVIADVLDPTAISPALAGADAVLTAMGSTGNGPTTVREDSARSIIQAMRESGVRRLIAVSGSIVTDVGEGPVLRYVLAPLARSTTLRHVSADMRHSEDEIRESDLDWTILRPPRLTNKAATSSYRTAIDRNLPRGFTLSRADLAAFMLTVLDTPSTVHRHIGIAN